MHVGLFGKFLLPLPKNKGGYVNRYPIYET